MVQPVDRQLGFSCDIHIQPLPEPIPVKVEITPPLPGLSPVSGKAIIARFDGGSAAWCAPSAAAGRGRGS